MKSLMPSNDAPHVLPGIAGVPAAHPAPFCNEPVFPLPLLSSVVDPDPSSSFQNPTNPLCVQDPPAPLLLVALLEESDELLTLLATDEVELDDIEEDDALVAALVD